MSNAQNQNVVINNTNDGNAYATPINAKGIKLPKAPVHGSHPFRNRDNHANLLNYLQQRLLLGMRQRDSRIDRLKEIDKNVAGWMQLDEEDRKRRREQERTGNPQAVKMRLPLAWVHLDDMMTYFATTFAPTRGMFYATGNPDDQNGAKQIVTLMNNHATYAGYFREVMQGIYALLKYNVGGFHVEWSKDQGPKIVKNANGQDTLDTQLMWQGNKMHSVDLYNFLSDPNVLMHRLHCDGEFGSTVKMRSYYWLQNAAANGVYFNCEEALNTFSGTSPSKYYREPAIYASFDQDKSGGSNWKAILAGYDYGFAGGGFELATLHIKLNPTEWGLIPGTKVQQSQRSRYETWRFTVLNDQYIIDATYMNNIHGWLPYLMGVFNDDSMHLSQKSIAEILEPLSDFSSFLMNTHIKATRKKIWGRTFYDPSAVDLSAIPPGEVAANIPLKPAAQGRDIRTIIMNDESTDQSQQTIQDLKGVMDVINQFFPTQSLPSQIASIDRAVDSQVSAVMNGANRRQAKAARTMDETVFRNVRTVMYYNIIQYQPDNSDVTDYFTGKNITIDLSQIRNTDLPFIIGQGLKAIDRQAAADALQKIIFALIQAPAAAQGIDLLGLINYWTDMIDIDADMNQFRAQPPAATGQAGSPMDAAAGGAAQGGITPAYAPAAVTGPIHRAGTGGQQ